MDRGIVRGALGLFYCPGDTFELRGLTSPHARTKVCRRDDLDAATDAAEDLSDMNGVYWSLNPIEPTASRASKKTVVGRRWFLIDVDPVRPSDVSSTDAEKAEAGNVVGKIVDRLVSAGWPLPVMVDSGNGWHLLYRVNLPNDALSQQVLKAALYALAESHDTDAAVVDRATHDAPRISKLPGTWARKGPDLPDRPHRMARIVYQPDVIEVVTAEQLHALGQPAVAPPTNGHASGPAFPATASDGPGKSVYVGRAIELECSRVVLAPSGDRNTQLNKSAFALGTMADWPEMDAQKAKSLLQVAADRAGLAGPEILKTITSGWEAGKKDPRPRPADPATNGKASKATAKPARPDRLTIRADEIKPEVVTWLWPNRIALGFISLFAGRTGVGKSFVLCDVAARLSRGMTFPDGSPARPINGAMFISEDPYKYVLVPRLIELGADLSRVGFMRWEAMAGYELADTEYLNAAWEELGKPELIVIDPPANFLGGKDEHKNAEVRNVLMKIVVWLEDKPTAVALITHYNKGGAQKALDALDRIMGSVAWATAARVACGFIADPSDKTKCIFGGIKNNLGSKAEGISYQIVKTDALAKVTWLGKSDTSLDDAMANVKRKSVGKCVTEWLEDRFREKREWASNDLKNAAIAYGFSYNAFAKSPEVLALPILKRHEPNAFGDMQWFWKAKPGWPPYKSPESSESSESSSVSPCASTVNPLSDTSESHPESSESESPGTFGANGKPPESGKTKKGKGVRAKLSELSDVSSGEGNALALRSLIGILMSGPCERDRAVVIAAEVDIPLPALNAAADQLGVEKSVVDGKEMWRLP